MPSAPDWDNKKIKLLDVIKTEEKGTDVNLAIELVTDAYENNFDYAMLFSNDSDMAKAIKIVTEKCKKFVGLYVDKKANTNKILTENTHIKRIGKTRFASCQLSNPVINNTGRKIYKPKEW